MIATDCSICVDYRMCKILKLLCVALLDDLRLSLECDALGVSNSPKTWTEIANGETY